MPWPTQHDTCFVPLRYFTDDAAVAFLNRHTLKLNSRLVSIKNYQEHIRGNRGLKLARAKLPTIVRLESDIGQLTRLTVNKALSMKCGLNIEEFSAPTGIQARSV